MPCLHLTSCAGSSCCCFCSALLGVTAVLLLAPHQLLTNLGLRPLLDRSLPSASTASGCALLLTLGGSWH